MSKTIASLFSGYGLVEESAKRKGYKPIWGVEIDDRLAANYTRNHGDHLIIDDIRNVNPAKLERPDILWASPSCKPFSRARCDQRKHPDTDLGFEVIKFIDKLSPEWVFVENVPGFLGTPAMQAITETLTKNKYWVSYGILDAHHHGTPQTRKRCIIVANRTNTLHMIPRTEGGTWLEAIADLIPSLPTAELTETQAKIATGEDMLIERIGYYSAPKVARKHEPCWTLRATLADDRKGGRRNNFINVIHQGQSYNLTPRAFARLMGVPDSYQLSGDVALDITGLGNGVPCPFVEALLPANS